MRGDPTRPIAKDLLLVGGGHSHLTVLRRFAMAPLAGVRVTLVSPDSQTAYSGMLPGLVAGHYTFDEAHVDLARLCALAGVRFIRARVTGLDLTKNAVRLAGRPPLPFDLVSLNSGSTPDAGRTPGAAEHAIPVKPVGDFLRRWQAVEARARHERRRLSVGIVGAGAGGVEMALALRHRLAGEIEAEICLFDASETILSGHHPAVRARLARALQAGQVKLALGAAVAAVDQLGLDLVDGRRRDLDAVIWTTHASPASWLGETGLALDERGFLLVDQTLRSCSHPQVFGAGDIATMERSPRPKSGVFAVRQGPPLAENLRRALGGAAPRPFHPQRRFLSLISTGDRRAVVSRGALTLEGAWVWHWKDWIDRRFMDRFNRLPAMNADPPGRRTDGADAAMRCAGCGAKVPGDILERVLTRLQPVEAGQTETRLATRDDAAVLAPPPGKLLVQSIDFFPALVSDPYLFGQIAANHCLGDLYAMAAEPWTALALATVPHGPAGKVEDALYQMLAGALRVLEEAGATLVGGHSGEGVALGLGLTVNGLAEPDRLRHKGGMMAGDRLILTKALGSGTLFAAEMRGAARGGWIDGAIATMLRSSRHAAALLAEQGTTAMTDVTGFGLAGHLGEMLSASGLDARLDLAALPWLEGADKTLQAGIESSLAPANRRRLEALAEDRAGRDALALALLCDPQTAGGLLAAVPAGQAEAALAALHQGGDVTARVIGTVEARVGATPAIRI